MKIKHITLLIAFTLFGNMLYSQAVPMVFEDWKTTAGTQNFFYKNVTKTDAFGNIYVAGATVNGAGNTDILLAKYNSAGVQLWIQQYAGAGNGHDFAAGLVVTDTYAILTGAVTTSTASPTTDIITMKYSSAGVYQWATTYNGSGNNFDSGKHVILDPSGNVYITGGSYNASGNIDFVTIKYNTSGIQQWVSAYDYTSHLDDSAIKVVISGSNLTVTGPVTISTNNYKLATLTYAQSNGSLTATNISTVTTTSSVTAVTDLTSDGSGNIYIVGSSFVSGQGYNYYVQKLNSTLVSAWTYTYNGASNLDDVTRAVQVDASGNVYISGYSTSSTQGRNIVTMKLNSSGTLQWTQTINGSGNGDDEGADMILDASANLYLTGYQTLSSTNTDYYTVKYNSSGTKIWDIFTDGISKKDQATNIVLDSLNNVIVTGQSEIGVSSYNFMTAKFVQKDVLNPVDLYSQPSNSSFGYHTNYGQVQNDSGKVAPDVLYYTHQKWPEIYLEKNSYNYIFSKIDTSATSLDTLEKIHIAFTGSNSNVRPYGYNPKTYPLNYFLGHQSKPITNIKGMDRVITQNIYPNIDLHYFSNSKGFKYYFVVNEGANPRNIAFAITGALSTTITSNNLFIDGKLGDVTLKQPYAYMVNGAGATTTLSGTSSWSSSGGNNYAITVPTYTNTQKLIIVIETVVTSVASTHAPNLDHSTYYGGTGGYDVFNDVEVSASNKRWVTGHTNSPTFPKFNSITTYNAFKDVVVMKYNAGDSLVFASLFGGSSDDVGNGVAVNSNEEIFIGGTTSSLNFTMTALSGANNQTSNSTNFNPGLGMTQDGFLLKVTFDGQGLVFGRYYGGSRDDGINSICSDASGNLYFTGYAFSTDITMHNAAQATVGTWQTTNQCDAIVGKLNPSMQIVYDTYFGGTFAGSVTTITQDVGNDITVDASGNAIAVGWSDCINLPTGNPNAYANVFLQGRKGLRDGYIARYSPTGVKQYASYFGGDGIDEIRRVTYDAVKNVIYFAGTSTDSTSFPFVTKSGALNYRKKITQNAFIGMTDANLGKQWSSFYGKQGTFYVNGISTDNAGLFYLSGYTTSDSLQYGSTQPLYPVYKDSLRDGTDGYIAIFSPWQKLYHSYYFGGTGTDMINNSDVGANKLYVVGNTAASNFPIAYNTMTPGYDSTYAGLDDGFVSRFDLSNYAFVNVKEVEFNEGNLTVYPNPANTQFNIILSNEIKSQTTLKVYTIMGQVILDKEITAQTNQISCSNWANGVYLINVSNKEGSKTFKVIKQ